MKSAHVVRNYQQQDFTAFVRLNMNFNKSDAVKQSDSLDALTQLLKKPGYEATRDLLVAEVNGIIIGYVSVIPELGIERVILDYLFHPAYCTGTVPRDMFNCALGRGKELGAKVAHVNLSSAELATTDLLTNLGFHIVRRYHALKIDLSKVNLEIIEQLDSVCCHLESGQEGKLSKIQNSCFKNMWGYEPCSGEQIIWWLNFRRNCPDDIILALKKDKVLGFCWTGTGCGNDMATGKPKGRIYMLGVDSKCRNTGMGRRLLLEGLLYLKRKGREIIEITVGSDNDEALSLYHSVGFKLSENTLWYEKVID